MQALIRLSVAAFIAICALPALAQPYPSKPVRVFIVFPPGGSNDVTARIVMANARPQLGQTALFENRVGASGMVGAEVFRSAAPDDHTFFAVTTGILCITQHLQPVPSMPTGTTPVAHTATGLDGRGRTSLGSRP